MPDYRSEQKVDCSPTNIAKTTFCMFRHISLDLRSLLKAFLHRVCQYWIDCDSLGIWIFRLGGETSLSFSTEPGNITSSLIFLKAERWFFSKCARKFVLLMLHPSPNDLPQTEHLHTINLFFLLTKGWSSQEKAPESIAQGNFFEPPRGGNLKVGSSNLFYKLTMLIVKDCSCKIV